MGDEAALVNQNRPPDKQILNSHARFHGFGECCVIGNGGRIEHNDVGVGTFLHTAFLAGSRSGAL